MLLSRDYVGYMAKEIVKRLTAAKMIEAKNAENLTQQVRQVMAEEVTIEDRLNEEVREILAKVTVPVLVLVADDDAIALSHTCLLFESIPGAQLAVVPGASHLLPIEQPEETVRIIGTFLASSLPPATLMPIRRA